MPRDLIRDNNTKSFLTRQKEEVRDPIDVIVGDDKDPSVFHPQMKLQRWNNEANVSFRLVHDFIPGNVSYTEENGVITWTKKQGRNEWIARFYEDWGTPEGAYKFVELILPAKPPTNQISFTTQMKDVEFYYQPPLTQEEIDEGAQRPEEVVGSYAIYSSIKGGMNKSDGMDYKTGKVGHLYRAYLEDANGDRIWADYNTDLNETGILTITVDQTWLDNAVYPVVLDPTFGYDTSGNSNIDLAIYFGPDTSYRRGTYLSVDSSGTLDTISVYLRSDTASRTSDTSVFLNEYDGTSYTHDQIATSEQLNLSYTTTTTKVDFTMGGESFTAGEHILNVLANGQDLSAGEVWVAIDTTITGNDWYSSFATGSGSYNSLKSDPWSVTASDNNFVISIYATYTAGGASSVDASSSEDITLSESSALSIGNHIAITTNDSPVRII